MMKWLRQHTKQIMVVVVLFSMLAFVGGQALQSLLSPDPSKTVIAKIDGQKVYNRDLISARIDVTILEFLEAYNWSLPAAQRAQFGFNWHFGRKDLQLEHWYLLATEAERAGIEVSDEEIAAPLNWLSAEFLDRMRNKQRITVPDIRRALRRQMAIEKYMQRLNAAAYPSEEEVRHYVQDTKVKVNVQFAALDANKFIDAAEPVTEDELLAQFDRFKNNSPEDSPEGFGYRLKPRVRIQYILASNAEIEAQITVSQEEAVEYWKKNKSKYLKMPGAASAPAAGVQPTEKSVSEALPDVQREIRQRRATQVAEQAMRSLATELSKPWEAVTIDPQSNYKPIPQGVDDPAYLQALSDRVQKEYGIPLTYMEMPLSSAEELRASRTLSAATVQGEGTERIGLIDYAFRNPVFVPKATGEESGLHLQLFQAPDAPLKGVRFESSPAPSGASGPFLILFRVVEAQEEQAPAGLEEVRGRVESDVRLMRAFQRLEPVAKEVLTLASRLGLEGSTDLLEDLRKDQRLSATISLPPFARRSSLADEESQESYRAWMENIRTGKSTLVAPTLPSIGVSEEFVDACFEMSDPDWTPPVIENIDSPRVQSATTRPVTEVPIVRLLPVQKLHKWFIIQFTGKESVDEEQYQSTQRRMAYQILRFEQRMRLQYLWTAPENIEARLRYERVYEGSPMEVGEGYVPPLPDSEGPI